MEEDTLALLRLTRRSNQSEGQFAEELWEKWEKLTLKMAENLSPEEVQARVRLLEPLLKLVLRTEEDDKPLPETCRFVEMAQITWEKEERKKERQRSSVPQRDWVKVEPRREERPRRTEAWDTERRTRAKRVQERRQAPVRRYTREDRKNVRCFRCDRTGHMAFQCPTTRCFECGEQGHQARRFSQAMREIVRRELDELLARKIIRKSVSPYNSPLWVVPKQGVDENGNRKYRVVVDFRELNKNTTDERYPLPRLEDILDRLSGARVFSTLDLKSGYHQVRMASCDVCKTAFTFERGHYEFVRMPFGLKGRS